MKQREQKRQSRLLQRGNTIDQHQQLKRPPQQQQQKLEDSGVILLGFQPAVSPAILNAICVSFPLCHLLLLPLLPLRLLLLLLLLHSTALNRRFNG